MLYSANGKLIATKELAVLHLSKYFPSGTALMNDTSQETTAEDESAGAVKCPAMDQNLSNSLRAALTADKDRLFSVVQDASADVLLAALRNPALDELHLLTLLKRRGLGEMPLIIYNNKRLIESYQVKFELIRHPETPSHIVLTLLPLLYVFDLLKLCQMPGINADVHLGAERNIIKRLPTQPLGNKLTLARRGTAAVVEALLREGAPNVVEACLDNPHLKEGSVYQFLSSAQATAETVSMVARSSRWKGRPNIRLAILKNPRTPAIWFTMFLPGLPAPTLRDLLSSPRLTIAQKELVRQASRHK